MKPLIGIILRPDKNITNKNVQIIYNDIFNIVIQNNGIPLGVVNSFNSLDILKRCDGIIMQGGSNETCFDYKVVKYCYKKNIPLLGICLGMQIIGEVFGGTLKKTNKYIHHYNDKDSFHDIQIKNNTLMYQIYGKNVINVNSRHSFELIRPLKISVSAYCNNTIEAIENKDKTFLLGVQYHPESINDNTLFKYFINKCQ